LKKLLSFIDISQIKRISFRDDLNGLRAIAVLAVVFYHADVDLFKGGWIGVDIFFVISGYLISNIIISELNNGTFSFKNFYLRRARRILPGLFSIVLITIPFAYFMLSPKAMSEYIDSMIASIFFFANFHFQNLDFYIAESTKVMPLLHTWSLAIEEQYYILFPLFSVVIYKYFKRYFALIVGLLIVLSIYLNTIVQDTYKFYQLQFRVWELLVGVLVMIVSSNVNIKHLEKIGLPLMLIPIFYFDDSWINDIEPKLLSLTGVALLILSNTKDTFISKFLSMKIISMIGLSSYSIYLLHQPIYAFSRVYNENKHLYFESYSSSVDIINDTPLIINNDFNFLFTFFSVLILLLIGYLNYKYIEINKNRGRVAVINLTIIIFFALGQAIKPQVYNEKFDQNILLSNEAVFSDYACWGTFSEWDGYADINNCYTDNNAENNLVFIGDSSTAAIIKNFTKENFLAENFNYLFLTPSSYDTFFSEINFDNSCKDCVLEVLHKNRSSNTIVVSLEIHRFIEEKNSLYFTDTYSVGNDADILFSNIEKLASISNELIFIEPFPTMLASKPSALDIILSRDLGSIEEVYITYLDWENNTLKTNNFINKLSSNIPNFHLIETKNIFCDIEFNKCLVYESPTIYYLDKYHLTYQGGNKIAKKIVEYIDSY
tara:strand:+ start:12409 stop:14388 length:1980 start_codon:yes stop_codon:yes gene_type:complete